MLQQRRCRRRIGSVLTLLNGGVTSIWNLALSIVCSCLGHSRVILFEISKLEFQPVLESTDNLGRSRRRFVGIESPTMIDGKEWIDG